jgi:hypothetical protein
MRPEDEQNITYQRRRGRTPDPPGWEEEEKEVREEGPGEAAPSISPKGKGTMGEEDDAEINSLFNILNDLAKGQKATTKQNQNGDGGSNNEEGNHSRTTMQSHPHLCTKSPRPTMPQFLGNEAAGPLMQVEQDEPYRAYLEEYRRLRDDFHSAMSFVEFCNMKSRNRPRGRRP